MAGVGPPPKPAAHRARTNATYATTKLPAGGRVGELPAWPLPVPAQPDSVDRHAAALWVKLWATPQACVWERQGPGTVHEVATYVRLRALADYGDMDAQKEARLLSDRLGLNPAALLRLRWEVVDGPGDFAAAGPAPTRAAATGTDGRYGDLYAIEGGAAESVGDAGGL